MGITDPSERYFKDGSWGHYDGLWYPNGMALAVHEPIGARVLDAAPPAGNVPLAGSAVPAGFLWVITSLYLIDATSAVTAGFVGYNALGTSFWFGGAGAKLRYEPVTWSGFMVLVEDEFPEALLYGVTAGDILQFYYCGFSIKVSE